MDEAYFVRLKITSLDYTYIGDEGITIWQNKVYYVHASTMNGAYICEG